MMLKQGKTIIIGINIIDCTFTQQLISLCNCRKRVCQRQLPSRSPNRNPTKMSLSTAHYSQSGCCPVCWLSSATSWWCCWRTCSTAVSSPNSCWNSSINSYRSRSTMAEQLIALSRAHQLIQQSTNHLPQKTISAS